jgi:DNA repair protein RadA/Sms
VSAAPSLFVCVACGKDHEARVPNCLGCGRRRAVRSRETLVSLDAPPEEDAPAPMQLRTEPVARMKTGLVPLDLALGGGLVPGSAIIVSGPPGTGKSTLALWLLASLPPDAEGDRRGVIYVTTEEDRADAEARMTRTLRAAEGVPLLCSRTLSKILRHAEGCRLTVIDPVHELEGRLEDNVRKIRRFCKARQTTLVCVAHVVKSGTVKGALTVEHLFDGRLHLDFEDENDENNPFRYLKGKKNRHGAQGRWRLRMGEDGWSAAPLPIATTLPAPPEPPPTNVVDIFRKPTPA